MSIIKCKVCDSVSLFRKKAFERIRCIDNPKFKIYECSNCKLSILHPLPNENEIAEIYRDYARVGNRINVEKSRIETSYKRKIRNILKYKGSGVSILDIGSGLGVFAGLAKKAGFELTCIEMEENQALASQVSFNLETYIGTLESAIGVIDSNFDVIHFNHVLEHVKDPVLFFELILKNFCKPDTLFVFEVPNEFYPLIKRLKFSLYGSITTKSRPLQHFSFFNLKSVTYLLSNLKLNLVLLNQLSSTILPKPTHLLTRRFFTDVSNLLSIDYGNIIECYAELKKPSDKQLY